MRERDRPAGADDLDELAHTAVGLGLGLGILQARKPPRPRPCLRAIAREVLYRLALAAAGIVLICALALAVG